MNDSSQTNYQSLPFIRTIKQVALELKIPAQPKINASTPFLPHQREKREKTTVLLVLNRADILELERDLFCCTYKKRTQYYIFLKNKKDRITNYPRIRIFDSWLCAFGERGPQCWRVAGRKTHIYRTCRSTWNIGVFKQKNVFRKVLKCTF